MRLAMSKGALHRVRIQKVVTYLVAIFASAVQLPILTHFSPELMHVRRRWSKLIVQVKLVQVVEATLGCGLVMVVVVVALLGRRLEGLEVCWLELLESESSFVS